MGLKNRELKSLSKSTDVVSRVSKGKIMLAPSEPVCIDWYWTTYTYDEWGNIIEILSEIYLYTTCTEGGGGGGGGGCACVTPPDEETCLEAQNMVASESTSINIGSSLIEDGAETRKKRYTWIFLKNTFSLWNYKSNEDGVHKKVGNEWQWESLTHVSIGRTGLALGAVITVDITSNTPTVGVYNAGMTLYYNYSAEMLCKGFPISDTQSSHSNSPVWSVNY